MKKPSKKKVSKNNSPIWVVLGLVILLAVTAVLVFRPQQEAGSASLPAVVSVSQAAELRDSGAFILDVREPSEWEEIHIPASTLIPLGQLETRLAEVPKDQQVVVICRSGNRSQTGRDILREAGFENVTSVSGGIREWQAAGYPTVTGP